METLEEVTNQVVDIIRKETDDSTIMAEEELQLSSIQILKTLAAFERRFMVEIEDEYIFSGMFSSPVKIGRYIFHRLSN